MDFAFPFRVIRRQTSPRTGNGSAGLSLQSHIASQSAHPQYLKKGDTVGGANLAEHYANDVDHRLHYLRRSELALTVEDFNSTRNTDTNLYDALHHSSIENKYPVVVTTHALNGVLTALGNSSAFSTVINNNLDNPYIPLMLTSLRIVATADGTKNIQGTTINTTSDSDRRFVPSWKLFVAVQKSTTDLTIGLPGYAGDIADNPLSKKFALKDHNHDEKYAAINHRHSNWNDLMDDTGQIPAQANHNHDDRYALKDSAGGGSSLQELLNRGIYPEAYKTKTSELYTSSLNVMTANGNYAYYLNAAMFDSNNGEFYNASFYSDNGLPTAIFDALKASTAQKFTVSTDSNPIKSANETLTVSAHLSVIESHNESYTFNGYSLNDYLVLNPTRSNSGTVVTQMLSITPSIPDYPRNSTNHDEAKKYKAALSGNYIRNGYNLSTAWYISSVLKAVLGTTTREFYNTGKRAQDASNKVGVAVAISNLFNNKISSMMSDSSLVPDGLEVGYFRYSSDDYVRTDGATDSNARKLSVGDTSHAVVVYDTSNWLVKASMTASGSPSDNDFLVLAAGTKASRYLSYKQYYQHANRYQIVDANSPFLSTSGWYTLNGDSITIENDSSAVYRNTKTSVASAASVTSYADTGSRRLIQFIPSPDSSAVAGKTYYTKSNSTDEYGNPTFTKATGIAVGANVSDKWVRERIIDDASDSSTTWFRWSKRPVRKCVTSGSVPTGEKYDNNKTYYSYSNGEFSIVTPSTINGTDHDSGATNQNIINYSGVLYTDYEVYTRVEAWGVDSERTNHSTAYVAGLFYNTQDTTVVSGKLYFTKNGNVFSIVSSPTSSNLSSYYECIDLEVMFDIWCAINQLITVGASSYYTYNSTAYRIKYNLGSNGDLIAWDEWKKLTTSSSPAQAAALEAISSTNTTYGSGSSSTTVQNVTVNGQVVITTGNLNNELSGYAKKVDDLAGGKFTVVDGHLVFTNGTTTITCATTGDTGTTLPEIVNRFSETSSSDPKRLVYKDSGNTSHDVAYKSDLHSHSNKTILDKFSEASNKLQYGASGSKKNVLLEGDVSDLTSDIRLTHEFVYDLVDTSVTPTPESGEIYYKRTGSSPNFTYTKQEGLTAFASGTVYCTRRVVLKVDGSKLSGTESDDNFEFEFQDSATQSSGYWTLSSAMSVSDALKYSYEVMLKIGNDLIPCPMANIAASTSLSPIYVPAASLIKVDTSTKTLKMKVPTEWMNIHGHSESASYSIIVRGHRTKS